MDTDGQWSAIEKPCTYLSCIYHNDNYCILPPTPSFSWYYSAGVYSKAIFFINTPSSSKQTWKKLTFSQLLHTLCLVRILK